ncbi:MAG: hypothetical protein VXZ72_00860 [Chlamydiota bacterium]|nr:hypothetical protein [Chlamydiota bacterium]
MQEIKPLTVAKLKDLVATAVRKPDWLIDSWVDSEATGSEHTYREYARDEETEDSPSISRLQITINTDKVEPVLAYIKVYTSSIS